MILGIGFDPVPQFGSEQMLRPTAEGLVYSVLSPRFDVIGTLVLLMFLSLLQVPCRAAVGDVMTVAGGGAGDGASATTARLSGPTSVVSDGEGLL